MLCGNISSRLGFLERSITMQIIFTSVTESWRTLKSEMWSKYRSSTLHSEFVKDSDAKLSICFPFTPRSLVLCYVYTTLLPCIHPVHGKYSTTGEWYGLLHETSRQQCGTSKSGNKSIKTLSIVSFWTPKQPNKTKKIWRQIQPRAVENRNKWYTIICRS